MEADRRFHDLAAAAETSGRRELITMWAERSATGCRLNALSSLFAGSTPELKRELSAFDDKVKMMERSMQEVCI